MGVKLLFFAGSKRRGSYNMSLAKSAYNYALSKGADATFIDLIDYPMPIMDEDLEAAEGMPEHARRLKLLMAQQDGYFIATPEYNSMFPPLLKNVVDWCSRKHEEGEKPMIAYSGKVAAISAASEGALGGIRVLPVFRQLLQNIGVMVVPRQLALSAADKAFDEEGDISDEKKRSMLHGVVDQLIDTATKMKA